MTVKPEYMERALNIARNGLGNVSPNPMVGAVIVHENRIIGEGYHRQYGGPHAEVNAIASVAEKDRELLKESTMYVTLEPCSHFGKTPPCADLIISTGIPRVVIGCLDPFVKVSGRGVAKLRDAGVEVVTGVMEGECRKINKVFMTAHTLSRPFVTLKWAQSQDGFMGGVKDGIKVPVKFSTPESAALVHAMRARHDAVLIGAETALSDKPALNVRLFSGNNPTVVIVDRSGRASAGCSNIESRLLYYSSVKPSAHNAEWIECSPQTAIADILKDLYKRGITSVLVEGGGAILRSFIAENCYDEARVEIAPVTLGENGGTPAPVINYAPCRAENIGCNIILSYQNNHNNSAVL